MDIAAAAINRFTGSAFLEEMRRTITVDDTPLELEEMANGVLHPITKDTITTHKQLIDAPL